MSAFREIVKGLNVFLIAIIAVALAVVSAACFLVSADIVSPADIGPEGWVRDQFVELDVLTGTDRAIAIAATAGAFAFALLLLIFESLPALMPSGKYGTDASGQTVLIDRRTIRQMIEQAAAETEGVSAAKARIRDTRKGLHTHVKAALAPDTNITEVGRALENKIKDDLRDRAGISISSVKLELAYGSQAARREAPAAAERPASETTEQPPSEAGEEKSREESTTRS